MRKHGICSIFLAAVVAVSAFALSACDTNKAAAPKVPEETPPPQEELTFLKAEGADVKNENGEKVYLRGVNLGGLFVTEHWMTGFQYTTPSNDFRSLTETFIKRFGEEKTKELWAEYRANWWTEDDLKKCAAMGINVIRLPFTYMNVDFDALKVEEEEDENGEKVVVEYKYAGQNYDFSDIDAFVERAAEYGIYTILDLHGAYGSHNGQDHSGQIIKNAADVKFFYDDKLQQLTADLWTALSEHYKDNPNVAGYDILNEPGEKAGLTSERHFMVFDKLYKAIRATGDEHIVIFESCWDGKDLPQPAEYGWENCMYSFHHYTSNSDTSDKGFLDHSQSWNEKVEGITKQNFGVPIYMGEFTNYTSESKWDYVLDYLNRLNWHWTSWTYKVWGTTPWGIIDIRGAGAQKVDAMTDEYEVILEKFKTLKTTSDAARHYTFPGTETTLESVFKRHAKAPAQETEFEEDKYVRFVSDYGYLGCKGKVVSTTAFNIVDDYSSSSLLRVTYHSSGDGSAYVMFNNQYMCTFTSSGTRYLTLKAKKDTTDNDSRFYPVACGDGWAFVSRAACKYLTIGANGVITATASTIADATIFYIE